MAVISVTKQRTNTKASAENFLPFAKVVEVLVASRGIDGASLGEIVRPPRERREGGMTARENKLRGTPLQKATTVIETKASLQLSSRSREGIA